MKDVMSIGGRLAVICAVAAVVLGLVNGVTAPRIADLKAQKLQDALRAVVPSGEIGQEIILEDVPGITGYYPVSQSGKTTGYVLNLVGAGYAGDLKILSGYQTDGTVNAVVMMENQETPGLGKEAEKPYYMEKYLGTGGKTPVPVKKSQLAQGDADAVSGATITFMAVGRSLEIGSDFVKSLEE